MRSLIKSFFPWNSLSATLAEPERRPRPGSGQQLVRNENNQRGGSKSRPGSTLSQGKFVLANFSVHALLSITQFRATRDYVIHTCCEGGFRSDKETEPT